MRDSVNEILSLVKNNKFEEFEEELKDGIPVNITNNRGRNALFYAKTPEQFEFLISKNIDVNATDNQGLDIINYIFRNNSKFDIDKKDIFINLLFPYFTNIKMLEKNNNDYIMNSRSKTIVSYLNTDNLKKLYNANSKLEVFKMMKKELYYTYESPLFFSDVDKKEFLLSIGQNVKSINSVYENALFYAKNIKEMDLLLKAGIDPSMINNLGYNFLFKIISTIGNKNNKDITIKEIIDFLECNYPNINILENKMSSSSSIIDSEVALILLESVSFSKYGNDKLKEILLKSISCNSITFDKLLEKDFDFDFNMSSSLDSHYNTHFYKYLLMNSREGNFCKLIEKHPEYMDSKEKWIDFFEKTYLLNIKNVKKVLNIANKNDIDFNFLSEKRKKEFFRNFLYGNEKALDFLISSNKVNNLNYEDFSNFVKDSENYFNIDEKNLLFLSKYGLDLNEDSVISQISNNPKAVLLLKKLKAEKEKQEIINSLDISKSNDLTKRRI